jgi:hypothetical protein
MARPHARVGIRGESKTCDVAPKFVVISNQTRIVLASVAQSVRLANGKNKA